MTSSNSTKLRTGIARIYIWRPSGAGYIEGPVSTLPQVKQLLLAEGATIINTQIFN